MSDDEKTPEPHIEEFQDVDFDIEKEDWNLYMLEDGTRLRIRTIALRIQKSLGKPKPGQGQQFRVKTQNIVVISAPPKLKGPPSTEPLTPELLIQMDKEQVGVTPYYEPWNVYRFKDNSGIKIKLVLSDVYRIKGKFDADGEPQHVVQSGNVIAPVEKDQKAYM